MTPVDPNNQQAYVSDGMLLREDSLFYGHPEGAVVSWDKYTTSKVFAKVEVDPQGYPTFSSQSQFGRTTFNYNIDPLNDGNWTQPLSYEVWLDEPIRLSRLGLEIANFDKHDVTFSITCNKGGYTGYAVFTDEDWYTEDDAQKIIDGLSPSGAPALWTYTWTTSGGEEMLPQITGLDSDSRYFVAAVVVGQHSESNVIRHQVFTKAYPPVFVDDVVDILDIVPGVPGGPIELEPRNESVDRVELWYAPEIPWWMKLDAQRGTIIWPNPDRPTELIPPNSSGTFTVRGSNWFPAENFDELTVNWSTTA